MASALPGGAVTSAGFAVEFDVDHGGRWSSLTDPQGREWLWSRPDPARFAAKPGDAFVDVGGLEECFPTIGPLPDHGDLWSRPWKNERSVTGVRHSIAYDDVRLRRTTTVGVASMTVRYELTAAPGMHFIWAAHALLDLDIGARILAEDGPATVWPGHEYRVDTTWPNPLGSDYGMLGPDDGTALFCVLPQRDTLTVKDGRGRLRFSIACESQPVSFGLWRNLGGFPWDSDTKYRSVGIEPMLGEVFDRDAASSGEAAVVPPSGQLAWTLTIDDGA